MAVVLEQTNRNDFFGYRQYETLGHGPRISNLFLENIKVKGCQCPYYKNYSLFPDDLIAGSTTN